MVWDGEGHNFVKTYGGSLSRLINAVNESSRVGALGTLPDGRLFHAASELPKTEHLRCISHATP